MVGLGKETFRTSLRFKVPPGTGGTGPTKQPAKGSLEELSKRRFCGFKELADLIQGGVKTL